METNGNVNYGDIHRQWHSSGRNYRFVCFQFLVRDIRICFVNGHNLDVNNVNAKLRQSYNEPGFSGGGVCGATLLFVCV
jgi:hypothetical protein